MGNKLDLSNSNDILKNLDSTTSKSFGVGSNVDWYTQGDEIFLVFGKNTQTGNGDNVPMIKVNSSGQVMIKFLGGQFQYLGNITGSNHPPNEDVGTSNRVFAIDNDMDSNSSSANIEMIFGRAAGNEGSYAAIRNYQGNLSWRNYGDVGWTSMGGGTGGNHTQHTDTGTTVSTFRIDSDETSNSSTEKKLLFGSSLSPNETGFRDYLGTMQYKNYGDTSWTAIGSGGGTSHTQNTDTGTNETYFTVDSTTDSNASHGAIFFGDPGVGGGITSYAGIQSNHGTLEYKNYGDVTWTELGSGGSGSSFTYTNVTGTTQTIVAGNGYIANNAGLVTFTLPAGAAVGTVIEILGAGAGGWTILVNTGQQMIYGNAASSTGGTGAISSTHCNDTVKLVCIEEDLTWIVASAIGELEVL